MNLFTRPLTFLACCVLAAFAAMAPNAVAEDPVATALDAVEAADYIGDWTLSMDFNGNQVEMSLKVVEIGGKIGATIDSERQPEPVAANEATWDESGLSLTYGMEFGGNSLTMNLKVRNVDGVLSGTLAEASGLFSAEVQGTKAQTGTRDNREGRRGGGGRRRGGLPSAKLTIDGKSIAISFAQLKADSEDFETFESIENGSLFKFVGGRATKLRTDANLKFGDTVVRTGNAAPDYPGVYSLWLKKVSDDDWRLVFNEHVDIWGTQHQAEADVHEIPIKLIAPEEKSDTFKVELVENGDGGTLTIAWGDMAWTADFTITQ